MGNNADISPHQARKLLKFTHKYGNNPSVSQYVARELLKVAREYG